MIRSLSLLLIFTVVVHSAPTHKVTCLSWPQKGTTDEKADKELFDDIWRVCLRMKESGNSQIRLAQSVWNGNKEEIQLTGVARYQEGSTQLELSSRVVFEEKPEYSKSIQGSPSLTFTVEDDNRELSTLLKRTGYLVLHCRDARTLSVITKALYDCRLDDEEEDSDIPFSTGSTGGAEPRGSLHSRGYYFSHGRYVPLKDKQLQDVETEEDDSFFYRVDRPSHPSLKDPNEEKKIDVSSLLRSRSPASNSSMSSSILPSDPLPLPSSKLSSAPPSPPSPKYPMVPVTPSTPTISSITVLQPPTDDPRATIPAINKEKHPHPRAPISELPQHNHLSRVVADAKSDSHIPQVHTVVTSINTGHAQSRN
eukprot:GILI01000127.1.p1 GENE.GILI01000127.1~~GILI01000127.1.p1  ORF type:complete len:394 (+),score=59.22 GILI01000127.1:87-1184(+)